VHHEVRRQFQSAQLSTWIHQILAYKDQEQSLPDKGIDNRARQLSTLEAR
jgi:hypothetical protein